MMDFSAVTAEIEAFDSIVIFRHIHPDGDAMGSQFGLKNWILDNWPDKHVYAAGEEECTQGVWPQSDAVSDEIIAESLAVVLDTATRVRADDMRYLNAKKIIKIDHHPETDPYGHLNFTDPHAAAACEILGGYFVNEKKILSRITAACLYKGILTDTLRFSTSNTTAETLKTASRLADTGIDLPALNRELFDLSMDEFALTAAITSKVKQENGFAWLLMSREELAAFHVSGSEARGHIDAIGHVRDFLIWAMFTENEDQPGLYGASLRSKTLPVNDIAALYGGGGHKNAAGIKDLSIAQVEEIKALLKERASLQ